MVCEINKVSSPAMCKNNNVNADPAGLEEKNILHIQDLYKLYGSKVVLDNIDLSVARGEFCTVVGPSGCGKSTLLRMILGQERPTNGNLFIDGCPADSANKERGIVYQKYSLFPHLTVLENVLLGKKLCAGFAERFRKRKLFIDEAMLFLEKVKLQEHYKKYPHELSGGMQQRVAIAQAVIMKPAILLMDEPFGALDPGTRESMQVFILELWEETSMTIFFVTHDLEEACYLGTRLIVLSQFYSDGRTNNGNKGAKIVADYPLPRKAISTMVKARAEFGELIQKIRNDGFDPQSMRHVTEFNLKHDDSFQTLTHEEAQR
jgi:NitT/TauT family transport system ATP-binding protein